MQRILGVLLLLTAASVSAAPPLQHGDVVVGGEHSSLLLIPLPMEVIRGTTATQVGLMGNANGLAFGADGRLYFSEPNANASLNVFNGVAPSPFYDAPGSLDDGTGIAVNQAGTFFFVHAATGALYEVGADATFHRSAPVGLASERVALDLAADQCTLYLALFAPESTIHRFNVCTWLPLPDLSATPVSGGGLRVDRDGSILASSGNSLLRLSPAGALLDTYTFPGVQNVGPIALAADGAAIWAAASGSIYKLDLASQSVLVGPIALSYPPDIRALTVVDEPRAAVAPAAATSAVPAAGTIGLAVLLVALAAAAVVRI